MSSTGPHRGLPRWEPDAAVAEFVHHAQPELGALGLLDPEPEHFLGAVEADAERDVDRLVAHRALIPDLHAQRVQEHQRVEALERAVLPLGDLVEHGVGHRADQVGRAEGNARRAVDLEAVELAQMALDLARAHSPGVHRDDLLVEARKAALVLRDQLRIETRQPLARHLQIKRAAAGQPRCLRASRMSSNNSSGRVDRPCAPAGTCRT
jgi:hypothetical protein